MNGTGVVTALKLEARTLGPARQRPDGLSSLADGTLLIMGGMGHAAAMSAARSLADAGAHALLSFGLAGGLDPALGPGQVVIPRAVIGRDGAKFTASPEWREGLYAAIAAQRPIAAGELLGSAAAIDTVAGKSEAFRDTGAVAVDMESLAVAQVAAARGLPFVAVRVIVDAASDALPRAVVAASLEGRVRIGRLIGGLVLAPADLVGLIRLARRYRAAIHSLAAVALAARLTPPFAGVRAA